MRVELTISQSRCHSDSKIASPANKAGRSSMMVGFCYCRWVSMLLLRSGVVLAMIGASLAPAFAQYVPPSPGSCASGFTYSAGVCVPRGGGGNAYTPPRPGSCATGFTYSAGVCVPRGGGATNAYRPPRPGSCATGFTFSAGMCVPRR